MHYNLKRTIHTDTYTPKSQVILEALREYMLKDWGSSQMERNGALAKIEVEPNGEIVWNVYDSANRPNSWRTVYYTCSTYADRRDDQKVREWLACSLKHAIYTEFKRKHLNENENWNRNNDMTLSCLSFDGNIVTVAEAYCIYEKLLNRKTFAKHWKNAMIAEIVGSERDPIATELEVARREESKNLDIKFEADKRTLQDKQRQELDQIRAEINKKYEKLNEELKVAYLQSKKDLDNALSFTQNLPDFLA